MLNAWTRCDGNLRSLLLAVLLVSSSSWVFGQTTLEGHDKRVVDFAWDPTGKHAASIDIKGQVLLWNLAEMTSSKLPSDPMDLEKYSTRHVQFSSDGKQLFVGCSRKVRIWNVEAKKSLQVIGEEVDTEPLAVSHNGSTVVIGVRPKSSGYAWAAHNTADGKEIMRIEFLNWSKSWLLDPNGSFLVLPNIEAKATQLYDLSTAQLANSMRGITPWTDANGIAIASGGEQIYATDPTQQQIVIMDIRNRTAPKLIFQEKMPYRVQGLQASADGKTIAIFGNGKINLIDVATRKAKGAVAAEAWGFSFCDDGSRLLAHVKDDQYLVADASNGRVVTTVSSGQMHNAIRLSPSGDRVAVVKGSRIEIRDLAGGKGENPWKEIAALPPNERDQKLFDGSHGYSSRILFSPKGDWLLYRTERASRLISLAAPQTNSVVVVKTYLGETAALNARSHYFSEDGKKLLYGSVVTGVLGSTPGVQTGEDGARNLHMVLDLDAKKFSTPRPAPMTFEHLWSNADGSQVAAAMTVFTGDLTKSPMKTRAFSLLNPNNSQEIKRLVEGELPNFAAFSPDHSLVAAVVGDEIKVWNTKTFEAVPLLATGKHQELAFSADSKVVYSYDERAGEVVGYSLDQGQETSRASVKAGHTREPYDVAFAHNSSMLVTVGENGEVILRSLPNGEIRGRLQGHTSLVRAVEFSADDKWLATADAQGEIRLWSVGDLPAASAASAKATSITAMPDSSARPPAKKIAPVLVSTIKTAVHSPGYVGDKYGAKLRFSANGNFLLVDDAEYSATVYDVITGASHTSISQKPYQAFLSPDESQLFHVGWGSQWELRRSFLGRAISPETIFKSPGAELTSWEFTPDRTALIVATRASKESPRIALARIDLKTGKTTATLTGEDTQGLSVRFSPDGKMLAALLIEHEECFVALLNPVTLKIERLLEGSREPGYGHSYVEWYGLLFSPDVSRLTVANEVKNGSVMRVVDVATGQRISKIMQGNINRPLTYFSNNEMLSIVGGKLATFDLDTGLVKNSFDWYEEFRRRGVSFDGSTLAEALDSGEVVFKDLRAEGKEISRFKAHDREVGTVVFSPDGNLLATMNRGNQLKIWNLRGDSPAKTAPKTSDKSARPSLQVKSITEAAEFKTMLSSATTINFDDIKTAPKGGAVEFKADRYAAKGLLIEGASGQFVSQDFAYPENFIATSKPNSYAPGPKAATKAGANDGGHETTIKFVAGGKPALTAGFGLSFIDANYPNLGESKLIAYDAEGVPLGEAIGIKTTSGGNTFRGIIVLDEAGKPIPVITSVKIINGSGWPEVYAAEGVSLDDFVFAPPVKSAP